jgi:nucleoside-diphosphate-sugar epimerase
VRWGEVFNVTGKKAIVKYIEKQKGDARDTLADADKMGKLGWKPKVGIEEGIGRFVRWYEELVVNQR